ncbi:MAG: translesion error-prone DNA polymerase V autoproteolytic subunit [Desulfovibrio sp.]|nr:translesion error-prone DNA polymerase V autoproteolytic subunit [Desulfovibrio sp.]
MKKTTPPLPTPPLTVLGMADTNADANATCPLYLAPVNAGWPSAAEDYIDGQINLHELIVRNPAATFFLRASGESMLGVGIHDGDLLVVDRSVEAAHNRVVIAALEGELLVKRLCRRDGRVFLQSANPDYPEFDITEREYAHIWGVVSHVVHKL